MDDMIMRVVEGAIRNAVQMQENGAPQHKILAGLVAAAENLAGGGAVSSILLLDKEGLLRNGASPQLPHDYLNAIDGLKPHPKVGTCAAAAATGSMVITLDFMADDKWAELRHLPTALGFIGAWSMPIKNADGKVLGTFGTYFREKREPSPAEITAIKLLAETAARTVCKGY
jgi:GAF domain-containing protein